MSVNNKKRALSIDALRGIAILTMVLSGSLVFGILPAWMYHAQTPPPTHEFNPSVLGITWVDLVFPFFLFAMGASFPFAIGRRLEKHGFSFRLLYDFFLRGIKLVFFAIFIQHMYPWVTSSPQDYYSWFIALGAFVLMFPMFMRMPNKVPKWTQYAIKFIAYGVAISLLVFKRYSNDRAFSLHFSNIIILVLANMAFFGSILYLVTHKNKVSRILILPFIMAVILGKETVGSWQEAIFNWSPVPWMYKFDYLKYLFIVLPGSVVGDYVYEFINKNDFVDSASVNKKNKLLSLLVVALLLIVSNLTFLFIRALVINLVITFLFLLLGFYLVRNSSTIYMSFLKRTFVFGGYFLLLGLFFEAFQDGVRKDPATFSYYFITVGLACMAIIIFSLLCDYYEYEKSLSILTMSGQNPMIAYVGVSLLVMPVFNIVGLNQYLNLLNHSPWLGVLRGVLITFLVALITMFFTKIKWFWRT